MSSILEKITLYDFFCYLIPGVSFESLVAVVLIAASWNTFLEIMEQISEYTGYLMVIVLLFGYLAGILLSELSRWFADKAKKPSFYEKIAAGSGCSAQVIRHALVSGGIISDLENKGKNTVVESKTEQQGGTSENGKVNAAEVTNGEGKTDSETEATLEAQQLIEKYINTMSGALQSDKDYKRIHDYSSFATMCKNLSAAVLTAGVVDVALVAGRNSVHQVAATVSAGVTFAAILEAVFVLFRAILPMALPFLVVAAVFWVRYRRFEVKTGTYIVIWYVQKETDSKKTASTKKSPVEDAENSGQ